MFFGPKSAREPATNKARSNQTNLDGDYFEARHVYMRCAHNACYNGKQRRIPNICKEKEPRRDRLFYEEQEKKTRVKITESCSHFFYYFCLVADRPRVPSARELNHQPTPVKTEGRIKHKTTFTRRSHPPLLQGNGRLKALPPYNSRLSPHDQTFFMIDQYKVLYIKYPPPVPSTHTPSKPCIARGCGLTHGV